MLQLGLDNHARVSWTGVGSTAAALARNRIRRTGRATGAWRSFTSAGSDAHAAIPETTLVPDADRLRAARGVHLVRRTVLRLRGLPSARARSRTASFSSASSSRSGPSSKLLKRLRAYRASDRLVAAVVQQAPAEARPSAEAAQLRERFEEAVATLKQSRRTGHSLYDLPWYVIIGAPGSGKTTALHQFRVEVPARAARRERARCAASAARATATGGSPTKRCFSTPRAATRPRTPTRRPTRRAGESFSRCCASTASGGPSTASS